MEAKDFMYINKNIPIDNTLPKHLLDYIAELEDYYEKDDWIEFDCLLEGIEATIKSYCISGRISEKQMRDLFGRYGLG